MPQLPGGDDLDATETSLVARAQAGDMYAFEQLASAHADRLFAVLLRLLGDRAEAEDVAQEVLLRAWRAISRFHGRSLFFTWLYRIAVNEANRSLVKNTRRPMTVPLDEGVLGVPAPVGEPSRRVEQLELREALDKALRELPSTDRTAIVLRDIEGLSTRDAAEITGVGEAAFKSRLHRARLKVRAALGDDALIKAGG